jgi:membrane protease YdiL (CAAX protease family)
MRSGPDPTFPGLGSALGLLALALAAQVAVAFVLSWAWGGRADLTFLTAVANLVSLSGVAALGYALSGRGPTLALPNGVRGAYLVGLGLTAAGGTVVLGELANLATWIFPLPPALARIFDQLTGGDPLVSLFTLSVVAPLTEEALFRGLLLRGFVRRWGPMAGVVLSSALFAVFHLNLWQALAAFAAGLYLGWVYLSTGSLWFPMGVHALFNGLPVALSALGFTVPGYNTPVSAGTVEFQPAAWVFAGVLVLGTGLWMTKKWAPLSPAPVSDTVAP